MGISNTWQSLSGCNFGQKTRRKKILRDETFKMNTSAAYPPQRPTDDLAGFEPGTSVTSMRAEDFHKTTMQLGYARLI